MQYCPKIFPRFLGKGVLNKFVMLENKLDMLAAKLQKRKNGKDEEEINREEDNDEGGNGDVGGLEGGFRDFQPQQMEETNNEHELEHE